MGKGRPRRGVSRLGARVERLKARATCCEHKLARYVRERQGRNIAAWEPHRRDIARG
jgi:hypothetical protein